MRNCTVRLSHQYLDTAFLQTFPHPSLQQSSPFSHSLSERQLKPGLKRHMPAKPLLGGQTPFVGGIGAGSKKGSDL